MSLNFKDIVGNIFYTDKKEEESENEKTSLMQNKLKNILGISTNTGSGSYNPYLKSNGELYNPYINYQSLLDSPKTSNMAKDYIIQATGLTPTQTQSSVSRVTGNNTTNQPINNPNVDTSDLAKLDVVTELPKLTVDQIKNVLSKHFAKSTVIGEANAEGIYKAQQESGMSALAILGIGALESGYGTSSIAKQKNNLWGWGASNSNPGANAQSFKPIDEGALDFANSYLSTYYNGYGAKSIYSAGTGNNPAGMGYSYYNDGSIETRWADSVGSIMQTLYQTATSGS